MAVREAADAAERERLVRALREQQSRLGEILASIERRDLLVPQVRDQLGWIVGSLRSLRKSVGAGRL